MLTMLVLPQTTIKFSLWVKTILNEFEKMPSVKKLKNSKTIFLSFSGVNTKQLNHYILPPLVDDKPDAVNIDEDTVHTKQCGGFTN